MKGVILFILITITFWACGKEPLPTTVVEKNDETYAPSKVQPVLEEWQHKTFNYFYEGASPETGMALEGNDRGPVVTTGGSGFGIMSVVVGSERGWITRQQAAERTQKIVRFLGKAERFKGMWSHWYNPDGTASPFGNQVKTGDVIESAFMMAGLLSASEYYTSSSAVETEIRDSIQSFWNAMDWRFYARSGKALQWLWFSQEDRLDLDIKGWNEGWIAYILALAAPEPHNISEEIYKQGWQSNGTIFHPNRFFYGYNLPLGENKGGPMFFAHYSFLGLNPRMLEDQYANYWNQNVAHTLINRQYCLTEASTAWKYDERNWGLTACYGGKPPWNYTARSPLNDDGVIAPTAALSSYPYTPFYSTQVLLNLASLPLAQGTYGFADSYCPGTATSEKKHLAIDQGPIVVMIENYRSGLIWNLMMKNEQVKLGLIRAGVKDKPAYKQGFHRTTINTITNEYDLMRHPDRQLFELGYFLESAGNVKFTITNKVQNKVVFEKTVAGNAGENVFEFDSPDIMKGKQHSIRMITPDNKEYNLLTRLR
ncbi:MAG: glucoamylase family protein [Bacteroidota bacterium]|nr:glucoamylase family protein [Bacteroidota bacterium]